MVDIAQIEVNAENSWRLESPRREGWDRTVRPGQGKKYFIVSVDSHLSPPPMLFHERMDEKYKSRLPRIVERDGKRFLYIEGQREEPLVATPVTGEDLVRSKAGATNTNALEHTTNAISFDRIAEQVADGVDAEVIFPNAAALYIWSSNDNDYIAACCRVWNDWAWEVCEPFKDRCNPVAALPSSDIDASIREVERIAKMGYRAVIMPCKPIFGPHDTSHINYNLPVYDPLWAAIQEHDLAITYHVGTGKDPRTARGNGGAIINYVVHAMTPAVEPIVSMCASGVFERFPKLRAATIEADAGWVPWMLQKMDEAYLKHHMWVRPRMQGLPSDYYRQNCFTSFGEDRAAVELAESFGLENNLMWANDYPHHEGSWPHSPEAIERTFTIDMKEENRAKLLGLNAARVFRFDIPKAYL